MREREKGERGRKRRRENLVKEIGRERIIRRLSLEHYLLKQ